MADESLPTAGENGATTVDTSAIAGIAPQGLKGWQTLATSIGVALPAALSGTNRVLDSAVRLLAGGAG